jgi:hypothetical protein
MMVIFRDREGVSKQGTRFGSDYKPRPQRFRPLLKDTLCWNETLRRTVYYSYRSYSYS